MLGHRPREAPVAFHQTRERGSTAIRGRGRRLRARHRERQRRKKEFTARESRSVHTGKYLSPRRLFLANNHTQPGFANKAASYVAGEPFGALMPLPAPIGPGGAHAALPGTMSASWILSVEERSAADKFPEKASFAPGNKEALVFTRMWRGWMWQNTEWSAIKRLHPGFFESLDSIASGILR